MNTAAEPTSFARPERRWWSLVLLMGYLASGFLLLMNCCFLGLRRYAARRGIAMPAGMAVAWLGTGAMVVALVVLVVQQDIYYLAQIVHVLQLCPEHKMVVVEDKDYVQI